MPWREALLRGQKVLARVKADGSFDAQAGRVEIRYRRTDPRAYRAATANLHAVDGAAMLDDNACVAAEFVARSASPSVAAPARSHAPLGDEPARAGARWVAYTDGACSGNPGPAGSGIVLVAPDGTMREGFEYLGTATNNVAELTAILRALEALPAGAERIVVHTDSQYAIGVLSKGWKPKANQELIATIKRALKARNHVSLVYVPGHAGVPLNERADQLAREATGTGRTDLSRLGASERTAEPAKPQPKLPRP